MEGGPQDLFSKLIPDRGIWGTGKRLGYREAWLVLGVTMAPGKTSASGFPIGESVSSASHGKGDALLQQTENDSVL